MKFAKTLCNNLMSEYYDIMADRINEFKDNSSRRLGWSLCCNIEIRNVIKKKKNIT